MEPRYSYVENRSIYRVDLLSILAKYFSNDIFESAREHIFRLLARIYDDTVASKIFNYLYNGDNVFKEYVLTTVNEYNGSEDVIIFDILFNPLIEQYNKELLKFIDSLKGSGTFFIADSFGYAYVSVKAGEYFETTYPAVMIGAET